MLSRWPIRNKLLLGIALLLVILGTLSFSGFRGVYAYRELVKSISRRAQELPLATDLAQNVSDLRVTLGLTRRVHKFPTEDGYDRPLLRTQFRAQLLAVNESLRRYRDQLRISEKADLPIGDSRRERETVGKIRGALQRIAELNREEDWMLDEVQVEQLGEELEQLHLLSGELPSFLQQRMHNFAGNVRLQYRTWIVLSWITSTLALVMLVLLVRLFYAWVFRPLRVLIKGSRRVAGGDFDHRIQLRTHDEMSELAAAMNAMTDRFQQIRDGLDQKVRERTMEVVRSEQLASVGVLAAGVAHEINNPLASIAFSAEALEERLHDIIQQDDACSDEEHNQEISVVRSYLRMIQDEAFRSKEITDRLLDFSRQGDCEKHLTNLVELVQGVIAMVRHLGKYRNLHVVFNPTGPVEVEVNPQELKQVVLNLITNSLEALESGGTVEIELRQRAGQVELVVRDDGCGMTEEVLAHIFEPFFTNRASGQGTGLGLAITHRIVADHGGRIQAKSDGPGRGSLFRITLPMSHHEQEHKKQYQAA